MQYDMILKNADSILKNDDANISFLSKMQFSKQVFNGHPLDRHVIAQVCSSIH